MEPEHPGCAFSVPAPGVPAQLSSRSHSRRSTGASTGHWTPREGRGGEGVKTTEARLTHSEVSWGGITHVLIYSTSSITLLLLLTPGDLFNCFFKSQYCHFIIPRLPLLLIKKEKEGKRPPECRTELPLSPGGAAFPAAATSSQRQMQGGGAALDSALATGGTVPTSGPHSYVGALSSPFPAEPGLGR